MKKSLLTNCSYFLTLLFLTIIAPIFISSDASAQTATSGCTSVATTTTGTAPNIVTTPGSCSGTAIDGGPSCSTRSPDSGTAPNINRSCTGAFATTAVGNANQNAFVTTICNALKVITGNGGKAFAAFAIISLGIGFFTGKVSWGLMIGVAAGIAAMFGAPTIVAAISGGTSYDCGSSSSL